MSNEMRNDIIMSLILLTNRVGVPYDRVKTYVLFDFLCKWRW